MLLKRLTEAAGVSSNEDEVRKIIKDEIDGYVDEYWTDMMGNLIAVKGKEKAGPRVVLAAHMDEVGLMISKIEDSGLLKFKTVGGIDERVLVSKPLLVGRKKIPGVIGAKAIHLQEKEERKKPIPLKELYIDIGAKDKKEAEKLVEVGELAVFSTRFSRLGSNYAKGKAFDDRVGCAAIIEIMKEEEFAFPIYGVFAVQEEVGLRGAARAAYAIEPDLAIELEGTSASDVPGTEEHGYSTTVGEGPAITLMDSSVITHKKILQGLIKAAEKYKIKYQFRRTNFGGTDAGMISLVKEGIPATVISLPCRYIHSPVSLMNLNDFTGMKALVSAYLKELEREGF